MFVAALKGSQCGMAALELLLTLPPAYLAAVLRDRPADALLGVGSQTAALLSLATCQALAWLAALRLLPAAAALTPLSPSSCQKPVASTVILISLFRTIF